MWGLAIKYLIFIPIILISLAQDAAPLYELYANRKMEELKKRVPYLSESEEKTFFEALFINDADSSAEIYKEIYDGASKRLKPLVARKLYEYYYARGFYITAERYVTSYEESAYIIQLGAFLSEENAKELKSRLYDGGLKTFMVTKEINEKTFYCIQIQGKETLEATNVFADQIGKKFNLKYRVIK